MFFLVSLTVRSLEPRRRVASYRWSVGYSAAARLFVEFSSWQIDGRPRRMQARMGRVARRGVSSRAGIIRRAARPSTNPPVVVLQSEQPSSECCRCRPAAAAAAAGAVLFAVIYGTPEAVYDVIAGRRIISRYLRPRLC